MRGLVEQLKSVAQRELSGKFDEVVNHLVALRSEIERLNKNIERLNKNLERLISSEAKKG